MRSKIHSILTAFCVPVMLCFMLPILKVGVHEWQATDLKRGYYRLYLTADIALSLIFAFCICYLIWSIQQKDLYQKHTITVGFIVNLFIVLCATLGSLISQQYPLHYLLTCILEHVTYPITALAIYGYMLQSAKKH